MHNENLEAEWSNGQEVMRKIYEQGTEKYLKNLPEWGKCFVNTHECVVCMDEGVAHKKMGGLTKFPMAGSGILFPASSEAERLKKTAGLMKNLGVSEITSHGGCGAAGLAYKRDNQGTEPTSEQMDNLAIDWAKKLADKLGARYRHVALTEMARPAEFHSARVVYFDGTGKFNPSADGLPMGFVISRAYLPAEYATEELKVAVNIAFGHHGFGELFTTENPFVIIVLGSGELADEATAAFKDDKNYLEGRIKVESVTV
ncbi:hypothetical protein EPN28_02345 [Patescibacteria group bacterium]|nr:MAG: hypothetical protein EPN28_02345 [Patescibacteria group bacterium]